MVPEALSSAAVVAEEVAQVWQRFAGLEDVDVRWRLVETDAGLRALGVLNGHPIEAFSGSAIRQQRSWRLYLPVPRVAEVLSHGRSDAEVASSLAASGDAESVQAVYYGPSLRPAWRVEGIDSLRFVDDATLEVATVDSVPAEVNATLRTQTRTTDVVRTSPNGSMFETLPVHYDIDLLIWGQCWAKLRREAPDPPGGVKVWCDGCADYEVAYSCGSGTPNFTSTISYKYEQSDFFVGAHSLRQFALDDIWPNVTVEYQQAFEVVLADSVGTCSDPAVSCYNPFWSPPQIKIAPAKVNAFDHRSLGHEFGHHVFASVGAVGYVKESCISETESIKDRLNESFADVTLRGWGVEEHGSGLRDRLNSPQLTGGPGRRSVEWRLDAGGTAFSTPLDTSLALAPSPTGGWVDDGLRPGSGFSRAFGGNDELVGPALSSDPELLAETRRGLVVDVWIMHVQRTGLPAYFAVGDGSEQESDNFLIWLGVDNSGRLRWNWERGSGTNVLGVTDPGTIELGKLYHVTFQRYRNDKINLYPGHPQATGRYNVEVHVREFGDDTVQSWKWIQLEGPTGGETGEFRIGADGHASNQWVGYIDNVRVTWEEDWNDTGQNIEASDSVRIGATQASYDHRDHRHQDEVSCFEGTEIHAHGSFLEHALRQTVHNVDCSRGGCQNGSFGSIANGNYPLGFASQTEANEQVIVAATRGVAVAPNSADTYDEFAAAFVEELDDLGASWRTQENVRYVLSTAGLRTELRLTAWPGVVDVVPTPDRLLAGGNVPIHLDSVGGYATATPIRPGGSYAVRLDGSGQHFGQTSGGGEHVPHGIQGEVTFSAWFELDSLGGYQWLIDYGGSYGDGGAPSSNTQLAVAVTPSGEVRVFWEFTNGGANTNFITSGAAIPSGVPYNIVVVRREHPTSSGDLQVTVSVTAPSINHKHEETSGAMSPPVGGSAARWRIGTDRPTGATSGLDGVISDVEVYSQALPLDRAFWPGGR